MLLEYFMQECVSPSNSSKSDTVLNFALIYHVILQSTTSHNARLTPRFLTEYYFIISVERCNARNLAPFHDMLALLLDTSVLPGRPYVDCFSSVTSWVGFNFFPFLVPSSP